MTNMRTKEEIVNGISGITINVAILQGVRAIVEVLCDIRDALVKANEMKGRKG